MVQFQAVGYAPAPCRGSLYAAEAQKIVTNDANPETLLAEKTDMEESLAGLEKRYSEWKAGAGAEVRKFV